jgi:hypothetical protein
MRPIEPMRGAEQDRCRDRTEIDAARAFIKALNARLAP